MKPAESTIQTIEIDAGPSECFEVASDLESYPEWAGQVRQVVIHERDEAGRPTRATLSIDAMIKRIETTISYVYEPPLAMSWTAEPGPDIKELHGSYQFHPIAGGTTVVYALKVVPSFDIPGFLRRQAEKQLVGTALRGLRERVRGRKHQPGSHAQGRPR